MISEQIPNQNINYWPTNMEFNKTVTLSLSCFFEVPLILCIPNFSWCRSGKFRSGKFLSYSWGFTPCLDARLEETQNVPHHLRPCMSGHAHVNTWVNFAKILSAQTCMCVHLQQQFGFNFGWLCCANGEQFVWWWTRRCFWNGPSTLCQSLQWM